MAQDSIVIHDYGISNIAIDKNVSEFEEFKPLKIFNKKENYLFPTDSLFIYFLSPQKIKSSPESKYVEDFFVITDSEKNIKVINIFFNSRAKEIEQLLIKKFGSVRYIMESSISGNLQRKRYIWLAKSNIEFLLKISNLSNNNFTISTNLLIYHDNFSEHLGEWNIFRL